MAAGSGYLNLLAFVLPEGFEPPTPGSEDQRSNPLSYESKDHSIDCFCLQDCRQVPPAGLEPARTRHPILSRSRLPIPAMGARSSTLLSMRPAPPTKRMAWTVTLFHAKESLRGASGNRTRDPLLAKQVRYQLRYGPEQNPLTRKHCKHRAAHSRAMSSGEVAGAGFEPATSGL